MAGDDNKMTEMKPGKPKRSLLERADQRFDFGGQLRRIEPGTADSGQVLDAEHSVRVGPRGARRRAAPVQPVVAEIAEVVAASVTDTSQVGLVQNVVEPATVADPASPPASEPEPEPAHVGSHPTPAPVSASTPAPRSPRSVGASRANVPSRGRRFVPSLPIQAIDRALIAEHGLIDPDGNVGALAEEYRIIKRQLLRVAASADHGHRVVVTSAQPDEGKTFSTINLALSLAAEQDVDVILVDGDFVRSDVTKKLGLVAGRGLLDMLADPAIALADCVIPTDVPRLAVLPCGTATARDTEYLSSARMDELLNALEADAPGRIILFDSMPLLAASSGGVIAQHCGQVVVVVRADVTREAALRDAIGLIGQHHGISLLLNRVRFTPEGRRFGSYYGEGG
jgi:protein-tyrosine kinase